MHYIIIIAIIIFIVSLQISSFSSTSKKLKKFKTVFTKENKYYILAKAVHATDAHNPVLTEILASVNNYLSKNQNAVSDFHLIKDIVDRNCDAMDEEISAQIPVPLYWGLTGTMGGILVGTGYLVISGGLSALLGGTDSGADSVQTLLGGVALAMVSSILGICLTTTGSAKAKKCKVEFEKNKNSFLSWIQAELLPTLSNNMPDTLERMTRNLSAFNDTFSSNTAELHHTLSTVNKTSQNQAVLLGELEKLKITKIASANIDVYEKLKNCTAEIGQFAVYMQNVNNYLGNVQALNRKLDEYEKRTQIIEKAGAFFDKNEKWLSESIDRANLTVGDALQRFKQTMGNSLSALQDSLNGQILDFNEIMKHQQEELLKQSRTISETVLNSLKESVLDFNEIMKHQQEELLQQSQTVSETVLNSLKESVNGQISKFDEMMDRQREMLREKSEEISLIVTELQNLTAVRESMSKLAQAAGEQNDKIDMLVKSIEKLAQMKTDSNTTVKLSVPKWMMRIALFAAILIGLLIGLLIEHIMQVSR